MKLQEIKKRNFAIFLTNRPVNHDVMEACSITRLFGRSILLTSPPPGSVNVRVGNLVEGPGGKWVPCATKISVGVFYSGLFEVGPGKRQVCLTDFRHPNAEVALFRAIELASSAAA